MIPPSSLSPHFVPVGVVLELEVYARVRYEVILVLAPWKVGAVAPTRRAKYKDRHGAVFKFLYLPHSAVRLTIVCPSIGPHRLAIN
jgi:hypothetical protein